MADDNCNTPEPLDVLRLFEPGVPWRNQDWGIVGPRIRVPITIGVGAQSIQMLNGSGGEMYNDPNINEYMPTEGKYWIVARRFRILVQGKDTQNLTALAAKLDPSYLDHTPKGKAPYKHPTGFDAVGSDFAVPSYGPGAAGTEVGNPISVQQGWRASPRGSLYLWDAENDSLTLELPASASVVATVGFFEVEGWAIGKDQVKGQANQLVTGGMPRHFQMLRRRLALPTAPPKKTY